MKQSMKTESPALAGQRETACPEEKRVKTNLEFSFEFSFVVLTCLFAVFVFKVSDLV